MWWQFAASLDRQTLLVITAAITLITSSLLATFARFATPGILGLRYWVGAFALYGFSTALRLLEAPGDELAVFLPPALELAANALLFVGACRFFGAPLPLRAVIAFLVIEALWLGHASFIASSERSRFLALAAGQALVPLAIGLVVWRERDRGGSQNGAILAAYAAFAQTGVTVLHSLATLLPPPATLATAELSVKLYQAAEMLLAIIGAVAMTELISERTRGELEFMATHDFLTGALTRRALYGQLDKELARARRTEAWPALCMIDVDHFKELNDRYGHTTGDRVLKALVTVAGRYLRTADTFARYGGEEFVALLPETTAHEALLIAERLRLAIEATNFGTPEAPIRTTVSIGIALCNGEDDAERSLDYADRALYAAKEEGRNKTAVFAA